MISIVQVLNRSDRDFFGATKNFQSSQYIATIESDDIAYCVSSPVLRVSGFRINMLSSDMIHTEF